MLILFRISHSVLCLFPANPLLFWMSSHVSLWSNISFYFAILINLIVAFFYPFSSTQAGVFRKLSWFISLTADFSHDLFSMDV